METTMTVRTKVLVKPSVGRKIFIKLLWASVIFLGITSVIGFFTSGFRFTILLGLAVPAGILAKFTSYAGSVTHYENCFAQLEFADSELKINYDTDKKLACKNLNIPYANIQKIEYSSTISCFKLTFNTEISGASDGTFHLLFVESVSSRDFMYVIERKTGLRTDKIE